MMAKGPVKMVGNNMGLVYYWNLHNLIQSVCFVLVLFVAVSVGVCSVKLLSFLFLFFSFFVVVVVLTALFLQIVV